MKSNFLDAENLCTISNLWLIREKDIENELLHSKHNEK